MTCTCPYRAECWHGDVCATQCKITERPGCFRGVDGSAAELVVQPRKPVLSGGAEAGPFGGDIEGDHMMRCENINPVAMIQGVLF